MAADANGLAPRQGQCIPVVPTQYRATRRHDRLHAGEKHGRRRFNGETRSRWRWSCRRCRAQGAIRTESARQAAAAWEQTWTISSPQASAPAWAPARWCTQAYWRRKVMELRKVWARGARLPTAAHGRWRRRRRWRQFFWSWPWSWTALEWKGIPPKHRLCPPAKLPCA